MCLSVFHGERLVAIITPALAAYPFSFDVHRRKKGISVDFEMDFQTADVFSAYSVHVE